MAQINIERKKTPVWPWVIGLILLALIAWAVYEFAYKRNQPQEMYEQTSPATGRIITKDLHRVIT